MCLDSGTFLLIQGDEETTLEHVTSILAGDDRLKLIDAFGKSQEVSGAITEIDLLNKRIVVG